MIKLAQVRKGPKGRAKFVKRGVIYLRPEFIGTQVMVMTIGTYRGMRIELKNKSKKISSIRSCLAYKNCVDK